MTSRRYCCEKKCFPVPRIQVDGMACVKCRAYNFCICNCITHINSTLYCCKRKCFEIPTDQVDGLACSICNFFGYCKCLCETVKREDIFAKLHRRNEAKLWRFDQGLKNLQ